LTIDKFFIYCIEVLLLMATFGVFLLKALKFLYRNIERIENIEKIDFFRNGTIDYVPAPNWLKETIPTTFFNFYGPRNDFCIAYKLYKKSTRMPNSLLLLLSFKYT